MMAWRGGIWIMIVLCALLSAHGGITRSEENSMKNYILDPYFESGAQLYAPGKPMTFSGKLDFGKEIPDGMPPWLLTQWNSRNNIRKTPLTRTDTGVKYENEYKTVGLDDDGTITLRVNAGVEYESPRQKLMDPWVHLYFEQRYAKPYPIGSLEEMRLRFSYSIPYFEDCTPEGQLDPSQHAVIAVFYIILKDMNENSSSYNNFINFCVMLYDNRTPVTHEEWHIDSGQTPVDATNMIIYTMDSSEYVGPVTADGAWHDVDFDPLPFFRKAFDIAQRNNCMVGTAYEDLAVSSVFFGYEVPGKMNSEMKIRNIFLGVK